MNGVNPTDPGVTDGADDVAKTGHKITAHGAGPRKNGCITNFSSTVAHHLFLNGGADLSQFREVDIF